MPRTNLHNLITVFQRVLTLSLSIYVEEAQLPTIQPLMPPFTHSHYLITNHARPPFPFGYPKNGILAFVKW